MTDEELKEAVARQPYEKVTDESIAARIKHVTYFVIPDTTMTVCVIEMVNGFSVRGESACVDPGNFNVQIGREWAYRNAYAKIWPLEGYLLSERRLKESIDSTEQTH